MCPVLHNGGINFMYFILRNHTCLHKGIFLFQQTILYYQYTSAVLLLLYKYFYTLCLTKLPLL